MAGNSDEDDLNLYDDLLVEDDQLLRNEQDKKTQQLEDLAKETTGQKARILELQTELVSVKRENGILRRNISSLYKTAKAEVERKDDLLRELQRRYDQIIFRRSNEARTFLGSNGRCSAVSNDLPATSSPVPASSSASVFKMKAAVSSKNSDDSTRNKIERSNSASFPCPTALADATAALPLAINRVSSTGSTTEPPTSFAHELADEERILGYASSSAVTKKKSFAKNMSSSKRKLDDNSISLPKPATSEHPHLENCSPKLDDVKLKNFTADSPDSVVVRNSSSNGRCSKTSPRGKSLERNGKEDALMIQRSESSKSRATLPRRTDNQKSSSSCSGSARRDTLIAKSLERRRYQNHVGRTKNLLHQESHPGLASLDSQYSKSLCNSTPENCQNKRFPLSMPKSRGYWVTSRIKSPLKNKNSWPNLKLRGPSEKSHKISSENNHPTRTSLMTTTTVNIEDRNSGAEGLSMSIDNDKCLKVTSTSSKDYQNEPQTARNLLDERQKANSSARGPESQMDKLEVKRTFTFDSTSTSEDKPDQIVTISQVSLLASSLTHESRVDHRRRQRTPTRDRRPTSIIDGRKHDRHDSGVAADCKRRSTVVRSPLKHRTGIRISRSSITRSRHSISSVNVDDQRRPRVNLETTLLNHARSDRKTSANSPNGRDNCTRIEAPSCRRTKEGHRPRRERTQRSSTELAGRSENKATGQVDDACRETKIDRSSVNGVVVSNESVKHSSSAERSSSSDMVTSQRQKVILSATMDHTDLEDGEILSDND